MHGRVIVLGEVADDAFDLFDGRFLHGGCAGCAVGDPGGGFAVRSQISMGRTRRWEVGEDLWGRMADANAESWTLG